MTEENLNPGQQDVDTGSTNPEVDEKNPQTNPDISQGQVDRPKIYFDNSQKEYIKDLMKKRVERSHQRFFQRYGAKDLNGLDEIFSKANKYDEMNAKIEALSSERASLTEQLAFIRNNVNPDKYDDIRRYFKGGNVEFSEATLIQELSKHPEWIMNMNQNPVAKTTMQTLGPQRGHNIVESDDEKFKRIFG